MCCQVPVQCGVCWGLTGSEGYGQQDTQKAPGHYSRSSKALVQASVSLDWRILSFQVLLEEVLSQVGTLGVRMTDRCTRRGHM
jgi:hypothetical protein